MDDFILINEKIFISHILIFISFNLAEIIFPHSQPTSQSRVHKQIYIYVCGYVCVYRMIEIPFCFM